MIKSITANLMVENVEETIKFYEDILGFSTFETVKNEDNIIEFVILMKDNLMLMFQERKNFIKETPILDTDKTKPSISLYIIADDFDELYKKIKSKIKLYEDLHKTFYESTEFSIIDNNGYPITIAKSK